MKEQLYSVRAGDTLHKIAKAHRCEVNRITALNHLTNINLIEVGQILKLPGSISHGAQAPENLEPESLTVWMQFVDVLNTPIKGLKVMLTHTGEQFESLTDDKGYIPPLTVKSKMDSITVKAEKVTGGWKQLGLIHPVADTTYVRLRSPKLMLQSALQVHEGDPPVKSKAQPQSPGTLTNTRSASGNPVQQAALECPNNDNLKLGPNFKYRDVIIAVGARTVLAPQAVAAIMRAEAATLNTKHQDPITDKKTGKQAIGKDGKPRFKVWLENTGEWDAKSASPLSSARGMTQFLDGSWIDQAVMDGTFLNAKVKAQGWLTTTVIQVKKSTSTTDKTVPAFKLSDGKFVTAKPKLSLARLLASKPYLTGRATTSDGNLQAVLNLRFEAEYAIQTAVDYGMQNLKALTAANFKVSSLNDGEKAKIVYLCHHLGLADAKAFINQTMSATDAKYLLENQVGVSGAANKAKTQNDDYLVAHREWLKNFIDSKIDYNAFLCNVSKKLTIRDLFSVTTAII
jgi:LysM repeat protein